MRAERLAQPLFLSPAADPARAVCPPCCPASQKRLERQTRLPPQQVPQPDLQVQARPSGAQRPADASALPSQPACLRENSRCPRRYRTPTGFLSRAGLHACVAPNWPPARDFIRLPAKNKIPHDLPLRSGPFCTRFAHLIQVAPWFFDAYVNGTTPLDALPLLWSICAQIRAEQQ